MDLETCREHYDQLSDIEKDFCNWYMIAADDHDDCYEIDSENWKHFLTLPVSVIQKVEIYFNSDDIFDALHYASNDVAVQLIKGNDFEYNDDYTDFYFNFKIQDFIAHAPKPLATKTMVLDPNGKLSPLQDVVLEPKPWHIRIANLALLIKSENRLKLRSHYDLPELIGCLTPTEAEHIENEYYGYALRKSLRWRDIHAELMDEVLSPDRVARLGRQRFIASV